MDKRFDKLEEKLDKIADDISDMKVVQASQAVDLKYHIKRTDQIENSLVPLMEKKLQLDGIFKLMGMVGSGLGLLIGAIKAAEFVIQFI